MNQHNLNRDIPEPVMREVRQRCGFGCIICGCAIVQYHHFDPEYVDAIGHKANGITLLCGTCHEKTKKGILGLSEIRQFSLAPYCMKAGFTHDFLFSTRDKIHFQIGGATFRRKAIIVYDNDPIVAFYPAREEGGPLRLFAEIEDETGGSLLRIVDNVWTAGIHHFDVETRGNALTIRRKQGEILLRMLLNPEGEIIMDRLKMGCRGFKVSAGNGQLVVSNPKGGRLTLVCPNVFSTLQLRSDGGIGI